MTRVEVQGDYANDCKASVKGIHPKSSYDPFHKIDPEFDCTNRQDGRYAHPVLNCTPAYFACFRGETIRLICPSTDIFDASQGFCQPASNVPACVGQRNFTADCANLISGNYSLNNDSCLSFFLQCNGGSGVFQTCPNGQFFNPMLGNCSSPENIQACSNVGSGNETTVIPAEFNCTGRDDGAYQPAQLECLPAYYNCLNGTAERSICDDGLIFNSRSGNCTEISQVGICEEVLNSTSICGNLTNGGYSLSNDLCTPYFIQCENGSAFLEMCPDGLYIDPTTNICATPEDVQICVSGGNITQSSGTTTSSAMQTGSSSTTSTIRIPIGISGSTTTTAIQSNSSQPGANTTESSSSVEAQSTTVSGENNSIAMSSTSGGSEGPSSTSTISITENATESEGATSSITSEGNVTSTSESGVTVSDRAIMRQADAAASVTSSQETSTSGPEGNATLSEQTSTSESMENETSSGTESSLTTSGAEGNVTSTEEMSTSSPEGNVTSSSGEMSTSSSQGNETTGGEYPTASGEMSTSSSQGNVTSSSSGEMTTGRTEGNVTSSEEMTTSSSQGNETTGGGEYPTASGEMSTSRSQENVTSSSGEMTTSETGGNTTSSGPQADVTSSGSSGNGTSSEEMTTSASGGNMTSSGQTVTSSSEGNVTSSGTMSSQESQTTRISNSTASGEMTTSRAEGNVTSSREVTTTRPQADVTSTERMTTSGPERNMTSSGPQGGQTTGGASPTVSGGMTTTGAEGNVSSSTEMTTSGSGGNMTSTEQMSTGSSQSSSGSEGSQSTGGAYPTASGAMTTTGSEGNVTSTSGEMSTSSSQGNETTAGEYPTASGEMSTSGSQGNVTSSGEMTSSGAEGSNSTVSGEVTTTYEGNVTSSAGVTSSEPQGNATSSEQTSTSESMGNETSSGSESTQTTGRTEGNITSSMEMSTSSSGGNVTSSEETTTSGSEASQSNGGGYSTMSGEVTTSGIGGNATSSAEATTTSGSEGNATSSEQMSTSGPQADVTSSGSSGNATSSEEMTTSASGGNQTTVEQASTSSPGGAYPTASGEVTSSGAEGNASSTEMTTSGSAGNVTSSEEMSTSSSEWNGTVSGETTTSGSEGNETTVNGSTSASTESTSADGRIFRYDGALYRQSSNVSTEGNTSVTSSQESPSGSVSLSTLSSEVTSAMSSVESSSSTVSGSGLPSTSISEAYSTPSAENGTNICVPPFEFNCTGREDGSFQPSELLCSPAYYNCSNGTATRLLCSNNLIFNPSTQNCTNASQVNECESAYNSTTVCQNMTDGSYAIDNSTCLPFYITCQNGTASFLVCKRKLYFDPVGLNCTWPEAIEACSNATLENSTSSSGNNASAAGGRLQGLFGNFRGSESDENFLAGMNFSPVYPFEFDCQNREDDFFQPPELECSPSWYACQSQQAFRLTCPDGLFFDMAARNCTAPTELANCQESMNYTDVCAGMSDGFFALKNMCSPFFVECKNGSGSFGICSWELYFDPSTGSCTIPEQIEICRFNSSIPPEAQFNCTGMPDGNYSNPLYNCSSFYYSCNGGQTSREQCPFRLFFDPVYLECAPFDDVYECVNSTSNNFFPLRSKTATNTTGINCDGLENDNYPDPTNNCSNIFYTCTNGVSITRKCAAGTFYDPELDVCDLSNRVPACSNGNRPTTLSPSTSSQTRTTIAFDCSGLPDGNWAAGDCQPYYFACVGGFSFKQPCPAKTFYDSVTDQCNFKFFIRQCGSAGSSGAKTRRPNTPPFINCTTMANGNYADAQNNCTNYYFVCNNGSTAVFYCAEGMFYNSDAEQCDTKEMVPGCGGLQSTVAGSGVIDGNVTEMTNAPIVSIGRSLNARRRKKPRRRAYRTSRRRRDEETN
ncbi:CBM 14 domain containing protein [Trichuris trichiura]|uniref:CBM 14 domain containing protein n=1 Tax=Trichuris trichiura TaxID=36087 RepID=A0A077ZFK2_TRITR|nr:CBM 14 domain containing protein [Trichuris trichiura]